MKDIEIKESTKGGVTQVTAQVSGDCAYIITCELASSHVEDYYRFRRFILIPSKVDHSKWDQLSGEGYCSKVPYGTAVAKMHGWIKEMIDIVQLNNPDN